MTYVIVCAGCDLLAYAERADQITCSSACRVRAHRNGSGDALRLLASDHRLPAGMLARAGAMWRLRPDLAERVKQGEIDIDDADTRREMGAAMWSRIEQVLAQEVAAAN